VIGQATAHRRAIAFAQALEDRAAEDAAAPAGDPADPAGAGAHGGGHGADRRADPEQGAMLALTDALEGRFPRPVMDPAKKTVQRAQLIAAMEQAVADGSFATGRVPEQRRERDRGGARERSGGRPARLRKLTPRTRLSRRLAVGGLTVGVAAGALGGVAAASTNALPGDTLYGLKRGMEDIKLDMAGGNTDRGQVYLDMAATRMQEARRLMDRGRGGPLDDESVAEVRRALSGMHQEVSEAHRLLTDAYQKNGDLHPIEVLNAFTQNHRQGWSDLRGKLPSQLTDVSDQVSSAFDAIDQEVAPLRPLLPKPSGHGHARPAPDRQDPTASGGTDTGTGSGTATPGTSATAGGQEGTGTPGSPTPTAPGTEAPGLIGGSGQLPPVFPQVPGAPTAPTTPPSATDHSVILPPLLPGLLPGLGLTDEDDS
jgi:hypothetical protein